MPVIQPVQTSSFTDPGHRVTRRQALRAATVAGAAGLLGSRVSWGASSKKLVFSWNQGALCLAPVGVARDLGFFEKNKVDVEILNFAGATDQVLESMATGKADVALGFVYSWLKPLETGLDVKIVGTAHAGCARVFTARNSGLDSVAKLKGAVIGTAAPNGWGRQFMSNYLALKGISPETEVQWKSYAPDTLDLAFKKGEINVIVHLDPDLYLAEQRNPGYYQEIANNLEGDWKNRLCCLINAAGPTVRDHPREVAAVVRAIYQASDFIAENPGEAAKVAAKYVPKGSVEQIRAMLTNFHKGYHHHPVAGNLRKEIEQYTLDLKNVGVIKKSTDPVRMAKHLVVDVLG